MPAHDEITSDLNESNEHERSGLHEECNDDPVDGADLDRELGTAAGHVGVPVDAVCTGCGRTAIKRAPVPDDVDAALEDLETTDLTSFKHVCHPCQGVEWWNPTAVLAGLIAAQGDSE